MLDTSAIVAVLLAEPEATRMVEAIASAEARNAGRPRWGYSIERGGEWRLAHWPMESRVAR